MTATLETTEIKCATIAGERLARVLRNAYLFTYHDKVPRPQLESVELTFADGALTVAATDSYGLYCETLESVDAPTFTCIIHRVEVKAIADALKANKFATVDITPDEESSCRVPVYGPAIDATWHGIAHINFPEWRRLIDPDTLGATRAPIGIDSVQLARLAKLDGRDEKTGRTGGGGYAMQFDFPTGERSNGKPFRVTTGTATVWQMPVRLSERPY